MSHATRARRDTGGAMRAGGRLVRARRRLSRFLLNRTLRPLAGLAPRSPRRWAFGALHDEFAGNPKSLFLWMALHRPDLHATWLTDDRATCRLLRAQGYRVRRRWTPAGVLAALRAGVFVYDQDADNVNLPASRGAFLLNLWHGVGLKTVKYGFRAGADAPEATIRAAARRIRAFDRLPQPSALVTTSDMMQAHFARQFRLPPECCPQLGYPRLDYAADRALAERAIAFDGTDALEAASARFREIYLYAPTFRDSGRAFLEAALPRPDELSRALAARDAVLFVKPHPRTPAPAGLERPNIRLWPAGLDLYPHLARLTGLVTDYSSILYDYLRVRRTGTILYTFDHERYLAQERGLAASFDENTAGVRADDFAALCAVLRSGAALAPDTLPQADRIRALFWSGSPEPASRAIVEHVLAALRQPAQAGAALTFVSEARDRLRRGSGPRWRSGGLAGRGAGPR